MNGIVVAPPPPGERSSFYCCAWCGTGRFNCLEVLRSRVDSKAHQKKKQRKYEIALKFAGGYPLGVSMQENLSALGCPQRVSASSDDPPSPAPTERQAPLFVRAIEDKIRPPED